MKKKILSIILTILVLFSIPIVTFATDTNTTDTSLVTFKANMNDPKIAHYYPYVYVNVYCRDEGNNQKYTFLVYKEDDFIKKVSLPNGNYVVSTGGIENDLSSFVQRQEFVVGDKPNTLIEFTVYKDMSSFADIPETTVPVAQPSSQQNLTTTETTTSLVENTTTQIATTTISETTTLNHQQTPSQSPNIVAIIVSSIFAIGIIIFIVFLIKKYKN